MLGEEYEVTEHKNCTVIVTRNLRTGSETIAWFDNTLNYVDVEWEEVEDDEEE